MRRISRHATTPIILGVVLFALLLLQFWFGILIQNINHRQFLSPNAISPYNIVQQSTTATQNRRYLIYYLPPHPGQGTGNIISGILAAHMLADEFDRIVCHVGYESSFDKAFQWNDPQHHEQCQSLLQQSSLPPPSVNNTIVQNNFDETAIQSECAMKDLLASNERILYYKGNTYPRWPSRQSQQQNNYFDAVFQLTQSLADILPWPSIDHPPPVVVHLRQGDNELDNRDGLDDETLTLLAQQDEWMQQLDIHMDKQQPIFLVTNRVEWYERFPQWSHPEWSLVHHSALGRISWGSSNNNENEAVAVKRTYNKNEKSREEGLLQMWADWYTLLHAKVILHTHSDFSLSAARWNRQIQSWTIRGTTEEIRQLDLQTDFQDEEDSKTPRLVDRSEKELKFCNPQKDSSETKAYKDRKMQQTLALMKARRQQQQQREGGGAESPLQNHNKVMDRQVVSHLHGGPETKPSTPR